MFHLSFHIFQSTYIIYHWIFVFSQWSFCFPHLSLFILQKHFILDDYLITLMKYFFILRKCYFLLNICCFSLIVGYLSLILIRNMFYYQIKLWYIFKCCKLMIIKNAVNDKMNELKRLDCKYSLGYFNNFSYWKWKKWMGLLLLIRMLSKI